MPDTGKERVVAELAERFAAPPAFVRAYVDQQGIKDRSIESGEEWLNSFPELNRFYINYALSSNARAAGVFENFRQATGQSGGRHLDVGCGYGGTLRAFAEAGYECLGVESHPTLAEYSQANGSDFSIPILNRNFLEIDIDKLGLFDAITCNEVIEHVSDAPAAINRLVSLLKPGGTLMMSIPNKDFIDFVAKDGHFQLFGITLLSRQESKKLKELLTGAPDDFEHMGESYPLEFYVNSLRALGLSVRRNDTHALVADRQVVADLLRDLLSKYADYTSKNLSVLTDHLVHKAFATYCTELFRELERAVALNDWEPFKTRYLTSFWCLYGSKKVYPL